MGIRYSVVANADELLEFWKAGLLLFNVNSYNADRDDWRWETVASGWYEEELLQHYHKEYSWKKDEWAVMVED